MWTPSHALVNAALGDRLGQRFQVRLAAFVTGAVAPDVPLIVLTLGLTAWRRVAGVAQPGEGLYAPGFDDLFFRDPIWVVAHNALHAPFVLIALGAAGWVVWRARGTWGLSIVWLAAGCGVHAAIDILTHHHDGPLLLFPFDWELRFRSAVSYWHPAYYGRLATAGELVLDGALAAYLVWSRWGRPRPPIAP